MGDTAYDCAQALAEAGACAVGANCGSLDPVEMAAVVATMREATPASPYSPAQRRQSRDGR